MRSRSYVAPFILIALGALFLINNIAPELSVWSLLGNWWPLLLILVGLIRMFEVLTTYRGGSPAGTTNVRSMRFGWIIAIIAFGIALSIPHHLHHDWHLGPIQANAVKVFGEDFNYPVTQSAPAGSATRLVLDNIRGNVTVTGSDGGEVRLGGQRIIKAYDRSAADGLNNQTRIMLVPEGDVLFVRSSEPNSNDRAKLSVDLDITVPRTMSIDARGRSGDLTINSVKGGVDISSQRGEVRLQDIGGNAKVEVEHCELVRASRMKGNVDVQGRGGDIQMDEVSGQVTISGNFSGTLEFTKLDKPLHFESEKTDMRIERVPGSINMDLKELRATNVTGPVKLVTHSRDVHLEDFTGPANIELGSGDVELQPAKGQKTGRVDVRIQHGNIEMALPIDGEFDLRATTQHGDVTNDFGDAIISDNQGRTNTLRSTKPSGAEISLITDRGEVSVRKLE